MIKQTIFLSAIFCCSTFVYGLIKIKDKTMQICNSDGVCKDVIEPDVIEPPVGPSLASSNDENNCTGGQIPGLSGCFCPSGQVINPNGLCVAPSPSFLMKEINKLKTEIFQLQSQVNHNKNVIQTRARKGHSHADKRDLAAYSYDDGSYNYDTSSEKNDSLDSLDDNGNGDHQGSTGMR